MATSETSASAIRRYVFVTSADPYNSTNWRFAPSSVFGFRSAVVAPMVHPSVEEAGSQKSPRDPQRSADEAKQDGDTDTKDVDVPQAWHIDLVRLAQMVRNGRLESAWHKVFLQRMRIRRGTEERML